MDNDSTILVLGAGGIKGYLELGAIYYLETIGKLNNVVGYRGSSVGAMICLLHNVGLTIKEITYLAVENVDIIDIDSNIDIMAIINNLRKNLGLFSTQRIRDVLYGAVISKLGFNPTFKQLFDITGKHLVIVEFDLSKKQTIYSSYEISPNRRCLDAVMSSINIPGIFYMFKNENGDVMIDGAFGDPYPVLFDHENVAKILGIYVETDISDKDYRNPLIYLHDIFHCLFHNITMRNIRESSNKCHHLALKSNIMDTIGATVTMCDKARMFLDGVNAAQKFFRNDI